MAILSIPKGKKNDPFSLLCLYKELDINTLPTYPWHI